MSIAVADHAFELSANPRNENACARCGRITSFHPPAGRDLNVERLFMADVAELVSMLRGMSFNPSALAAYTRKVHERLAIGEERYGGTEFLNRDNLVEVADETPDVAAYGLLEVERLQREGLDEQAVGEVRSALVTAAAYTAIADEYVRVAKAARAA